MDAHNHSGNFWGNALIRSDKSASPLLEQLCLGIAKTIATTFEPTATDQLTPQKVAAYYRSVGGNYDGIFLNTPNASLSLIYRSLGCFHSLQPTSHAFESPSIPALLPNGFVRWQTMQLLLNPDEHVPWLQQAVKRFDIVNPTTGAKFPKTLPRDAFPEKPDDEICKWHKMISERLEQDFNTRRIKAASPLYSPRGERNSYDGAESDYFPHSPHRGHAKRRPSQPSRSSSHDQRKTSHSSDRRGSLPDQGPSAWPSTAEPSVHWAPSDHKSPRESSAANRVSSSSAHSQSRHRNSNASSHHRPTSASNHTHPPQPHSAPPEQANMHPAHRHELRSSEHRHRHRPIANSGARLRPRSPITGTSSGSAASSEESIPPQTAHPAYDRGRRRDSLFPPNALTNGVKRGLHHLRRHSHDATYRKVRDKELSEARPPLPPRPDIPNMRQAYEKDRDRRRPPPSQPQPQPPPALGVAIPAPLRNGNQVKFHERMFSGDNDEYTGGANSAPDSPATKNSASTPRFKYTDSRGKDLRSSVQNGRSRSGSEADRVPERQRLRQQGAPGRIKTVSGVGGRKYASAEFESSPTAEPVLERA